MKKYILYSLISVLVASKAGANGWVELFDGETLEGWTKRGGDATYHVEKGAIVGVNGPRHNTFLCTNKSYRDFELEFEVLLPNPLNSGVQIRSKEKLGNHSGDEVLLVYGPQVEIERTPGESGYLYGEKLGTGWLTSEEDLKKHSVFRNDDWNQYRIVAKGPRIQTYVNGRQIADLWDEVLYEGHASGFIGLQVHRSKHETGTRVVKWRNIRIREIEADGWQCLFNGTDLSGWTPKITGYPAGENPGDIFRVHDGVIRATHREFDVFDGEFGHLFYDEPFRSYKIRFEYRILGNAEGQVSGAPAYAFRNSGLMIHGETPEDMQLNQKFPLSLEVQLLGATEKKPKRQTGNLCTPGTQVYMDGELVVKHGTKSSSSGYVGDQWVRVEVHVFGDREIIHFINGREVIRYQSPERDDGTPLGQGTVSLQAEGHDVEFRDIEIYKIN